MFLQPLLLFHFFLYYILNISWCGCFIRLQSFTKYIPRWQISKVVSTNSFIGYFYTEIMQLKIIWISIFTVRILDYYVISKLLKCCQHHSLFRAGRRLLCNSSLLESATNSLQSWCFYKTFIKMAERVPFSQYFSGGLWINRFLNISSLYY